MWILTSEDICSSRLDKSEHDVLSSSGNGAPALVTCDVLNLLPHIVTYVIGVEVPLQSLLMFPLCLVDTSFQSCAGDVVSLLSRDRTLLYFVIIIL